MPHLRSLLACSLTFLLAACGGPSDASDAGSQTDAGLPDDAGHDAGSPVEDAAANTPPDAVDDTVEVPPVVATSIDVLANDSDPDGDPLTIVGVGDAEVGTVTFDGEHVTYQPPAAFRGSDELTYRISDGRGGEDTATVHVMVTPDPNDPPTAVDDDAETDAGTAVTIDVLANDFDPNADALSIAHVAAPSSGSTTTDGATIEYTPAPGFVGSDSFQYDVADARGATATATVHVEVFGAPDAVDDDASAVERDPVRVDVLANDTHPNGLALALDAIGAPSHGSAMIDTGAVVYAADLGFIGVDTLTYTVRDTRGATDTATITIDVRPGARSVDIAAGGNQSYAIGPDGSLDRWGSENNIGLGDATPQPVGSGTSWVDVEAGQNHACAIDESGDLYCWGDNNQGQLGIGDARSELVPARVGTDSGWTVVSTGGSHTCGILAGDLYCWGWNIYGQLGDGSTYDQDTPALVAGDGRPWTSVAAGGYHTCGVRGGELWCWGGTSRDVLGDPSAPLLSVHTPRRIGSNTDWARLVAGDYHTCGLKTDGSLFCWGSGSLTGTGGSVDVPTRVGSSTAWTDIDAGRFTTCGVDAGTIYCWGQNAWGQVGDGTQIDRPTPVAIGSATDWARVAVGTDHACGTRASGVIYCWGRRSSGQIGDGVLVGSLVPARVGTSNDWAHVTAGGDVFWNAYGCGIRTDGTLWCWGAMQRTGLGGPPGTAAPAQVGSASSWTAVVAGHAHVCALQADHSLWCWGEDDYGKLGVGGTGDSAVPLRVGGTATYRAVAAGTDHSCAIADDGALYCWGSNRNGELGSATPSTVPQQVGTELDWESVTAGDYFTCATRAGGTLWCWGGAIGSTPTQVGTDTGWTDVSAGEQAYGIRGGALYSGIASLAPMQVGTDTEWASISARATGHECVIRSDGSLWCFGENRHGQLGDGTTMDRVLPGQVGSATDWVDVAAAGHSSYEGFACGVRAAGSLWCWGSGDFGQLGLGNVYTAVPVPVASP